MRQAGDTVVQLQLACLPETLIKHYRAQTAKPKTELQLNLRLADFNWAQLGAQAVFIDVVP